MPVSIKIEPARVKKILFGGPENGMELVVVVILILLLLPKTRPGPKMETVIISYEA
jgi:hypothetical protein